MQTQDILNALPILMFGMMLGFVGYILGVMFTPEGRNTALTQALLGVIVAELVGLGFGFLFLRIWTVAP